MPATEPLRPVALKREGDDWLIIQWSDGHRSMYTWQHLRANCPCASCRDERDRPPDPFRILKPNEVPNTPLRPVAMQAQGRYAYKITWSDGHDTGIYTIENLRALCQCEACGGVG